MYLVLSCLVISYGQKDKDAPSESAESASGKIRIASCQFPISANIMENLRWIEEQLIEAKLRKVDIVHFPECA